MKGKIKYIIIAFVLLLSLLGVAYAFYEFYAIGDNHELIVGNLYLKLNDGTDTISLTNVFPETKEEARARKDNQVTFTVTGLNTTNDNDIYYDIMLENGDSIDGKTRAKANTLVFDLVQVNADGSETLLVDAQSFADIDARIIWVDNVLHDATTEVKRTYKLRMWLSEDVLISDSNPNADYTTSEFGNGYASVKVSVFGDFSYKEVPLGYLTYDLRKLGLDNPPKTRIHSNTTITTEVPTTTQYEFLGWSRSYNGSVEYNPGDTIKSADVINGNLTLYPVVQADFKETIETNLSTYLQTADTEGNRYLTGDKDTPNYVWYSGKLWRIVAINSDNTIKLVTQGNMTAIAWDTTSTNTNYSTSQMRTWLNNEFLPTLANADTLLADSIWDYTTYASATTKLTPTSTVANEKVGLLTIYDSYKVGTSSSSFLNNGYFWWTMSPQTDGSRVWNVDTGSYSYNYGILSNLGVRPSVNLKSDIQITGGFGTKSNPYVIGGDKGTGVISELLNNRISGEYIKFNDVLYRIVGTEEFEGQMLTKITMADYSLNKNNINEAPLAFGSSSQATYSPTYGIGLYLDEWYQADSTSETYATTYIKNNYKAMIAIGGKNGDGIIWYTGPTNGLSATSSYTLSKMGMPVSATIGLGYYGEMFSSQFGDGYNSSTSIWLMTRWGTLNDLVVFDNSVVSGASASTYYMMVRPSMYLKSNVKIVSGSGMQNDPYVITQ